jgi:hypothetical protein
MVSEKDKLRFEKFFKKKRKKRINVGFGKDVKIKMD